MEIKEELFRPILITKGRKTGREHKVMLRAVNHNGKIYFSRHKPDGSVFIGNAKLVTDETLNEKISFLKYPGEERAKEKRVAIEVTLN